MSLLVGNSSLLAQYAFSVQEESAVGQARRAALQLASYLKMNDSDAGRVGIAVTEMGTNLIKHGKEGEILLRSVDHHGRFGVEVLAVDKGKGMADVSRCLSDGYSTAGSQGTGLGAIRRQSEVFDVFTAPNKGTAVLAQIYNEGRAPVSGGGVSLQLGVVCRPKRGEESSGDNWAYRTDNQWLFMVADGLGHGPAAADASQEAVRSFQKTELKHSVTDLLETMHLALRKTRGAAGAVAQIDIARAEVRFSGVGNIAASILGGGTSRSMVSHNGILGHEVRKIQEFTYAWPVNSTLIMSSDGLATWNLDNYPGLLMRHPGLIAGVLYRDYWRQRDDVTVLVVRSAKEAA